MPAALNDWQRSYMTLVDKEEGRDGWSVVLSVSPLSLTRVSVLLDSHSHTTHTHLQSTRVRRLQESISFRAT